MIVQEQRSDIDVLEVMSIVLEFVLFNVEITSSLLLKHVKMEIQVQVTDAQVLANLKMILVIPAQPSLNSLHLHLIRQHVLEFVEMENEK